MTEFTDEESKKLIEAFKTLAIKPKFDSPDELSAWLASHASAVGGKDVKQEHDNPPTVTTPVTTTMAHQLPRISFFSGGSQKPSDTPYDLWRYEVKCLMIEKVYSSATVANAVRRSLKGEAGRTAMILGPNADVQEIIAKLDSIYGPIDLKESLLASFYSARQGDDEDVSSWGCRLEDLLSKAAETQGHVQHSQMNDMLRNMFWTGLKKSLKDVSGHKFDATTDFDTLRVSVRRIEQDQKQRLSETTSKKPQSAKMATASQARDTELSEIKGMIRQLSAEMATMKQQQNVKDETPPAHVYDGSRQRGQGHGRYDSSSQHNQGMYYGNNAPQYAHAAPSYPQASSYSRGQSYSPQPTGYGGNEPTCWRCGQLGHFQSGCRVILDHVRRPLNARGPMGRGRP
jgi:hypothetical protein